MPAILLALGSMLITLLRTYLPGIVGRVLLTLGIGFVAHKVALPALLVVASSYINDLPPVLRAYTGALGIDVVVVMILSALAAVRAQKLVLSKIGGGT